MTHERLRSRRLGAALSAVVLLGGACGGDSGNGYDVLSSVVAHETTQDILVFEPDAEGAWPVVFALHGIDGSADHMAELGRRLAQEGMLVFAPNYHTDFSTDEGYLTLVRDVECAYRFARSVAAEHGGDLDQPVTFLGWSLGASFAIQGGLDEEIDPSQQYVSCFAEVPRADVVVAVSGCHSDVPPMAFNSDEWTNDDVEIVLLAGDEDTNCPAAQSAAAASELRSAGYEADLMTMAGADHFAPIFHELVDGEMVPAPEDPAGEEVLEATVAAVAAAR